MTSLPTTTSAEMLPGAAPTLGANAPLADGLASLFAPATGAPANSSPGTLVPEFIALLDGTARAVPAVAAPTAASAPVRPSAVPTAGALPNAPTSPGLTPSLDRPASPSFPDEVLTPSREGALPNALTDARELSFAPARVSTPDVAEAAAAIPPRAAQRDTAPTVPDRTTMEAVVALLAPVMGAIAPQAPIGPGDESLSPAVPVLQSNDSAPALPDSLGEKSEPAAPRPALITFTAPGQAPVALRELHPSPAAKSSEAPSQIPLGGAPIKALLPSDNAAVSPAAQPSVAPVRSAAAPTVAARAAAPLAIPAPAVPEVEVSATVELADGSVVAVALPQASERRAAASPAMAVRPEKSAGVSAEKNLPDSARDSLSGKNFLSAEEQGLSPVREKAGIAVAETRPTMFAPPHVTLPAVHSTVPALVSMESVVPPAATSAPEPMPQLVAVSLAHRAVETVTNVVEAQAASKLQPVPSVQLKFKIGADDLAVRVELRDGVVRTEFRTDSPELRAAIANEWKSVTAQPEAALRFLEPVVTSSSSSPGGTNGFSQQHQHSPGQSAAQQQQQQQQQSRAAAEVFGSVGRSTPFQPREGGAAQSNVSPIALPTSVHLSAVA